MKVFSRTFHVYPRTACIVKEERGWWRVEVNSQPEGLTQGSGEEEEKRESDLEQSGRELKRWNMIRVSRHCSVIAARDEETKSHS